MKILDITINIKTIGKKKKKNTSDGGLKLNALGIGLLLHLATDRVGFSDFQRMPGSILFYIQSRNPVFEFGNHTPNGADDVDGVDLRNFLRLQVLLVRNCFNKTIAMVENIARKHLKRMALLVPRKPQEEQSSNTMSSIDY